MSIIQLADDEDVSTERVDTFNKKGKHRRGALKKRGTRFLASTKLMALRGKKRIYPGKKMKKR